MSNESDNTNKNQERIFSYSRAQAIEDGILVDASEMASEAGFRFPVALTATAYGKYVEVPEIAVVPVCKHAV